MTIIASAPEQTNVTPDTKRAAYIKGLRAVADLLEAHPELPLPYDGDTTKGLAWIETAPHAYDLARMFTLLVPGATRETDAKLVGWVHGVKVEFHIAASYQAQAVAR